ncbi:MAG: S9 family peptidase [Alphaproteobacteria bacterium]|nr:S9 family peptidase [Alphaproteobacteria bacterium]
MIIRALVASAILLCVGSATAADPRRAPSTKFEAADVFAMEWAAGPAIAPDGSRVAYVRVSGDVMKDRFRRSIWLVDANGQNHRPLVQGAGSYSSPVWSPDGRAIAYTATEQTGAEVRIFYLDTRQSATLARLPSAAQNLTWSPDGRTLAFQSFVTEKGRDPAGMPPKPEGAEWAPPARVVDTLVYRADGDGFLNAGFTQIFVLPADGGSPRQLTWAPRNHDGRLSWSGDAAKLYFSANAEENWQTAPVESDVYALTIADGSIARLTTRKGPDADPTLSPDGARLAYVGFDDREQGYQVTELWVADANGANPRSLTARFDRDITRPEWTRDGRAIVFLYEDHGQAKIGRIGVNGGAVTTLIGNVGGMDPGRPYTSGAFSLARNGAVAATVGSATQPANIAVSTGGGARQLTRLNDDLFAGKTIPGATLLTAKSSADGREIEAWVVRPPDFDASKKYPLLLEIHGGPFTAYGPNWAAEVQMYASAGYIVVYANPRGSTSYGGAFGNLIHHAYPSKDYDDLMSVVDAAIAREPIDPTKLFVTGGSGGGVLTAWIVGTTDRFAAAMVQKPVINWTSFVLTADGTNFFYRYWFPGPPWEHQEQYWQRSPLSRVGNVKTPTAVLSGEADLRTPISEAEQYYTALRMRNVPTRLVRIPGSFHDIAARPSGLIAKVNNTLVWFGEHGGPKPPEN